MAIAIPFAIAILVGIAHVTHPYLVDTDLALTEIQVRDVGERSVLLGPYSRFGWQHPGPTLFYLLSLPYRLFGERPRGLLLGALAINGASAVAIAWIAWRRGGRTLLLWALLALLLLMRTVDPTVWSNVWNPYITLLPCALLMMLTWSIACGDRWALPGAALVGTFLIQSHVGYLPVVAMSVTLGCALFGWLNRPTRLRRLLIPGVLTVAVLIVTWLPPVIEQRREPVGNLTLLRQFLRGHGTQRSIWTATGEALRDLGALGAAATGTGRLEIREGIQIPTWTGWVTLAVMLAAAVTIVKCRDRVGMPLAALTTGAFVVAIASITRIVGPPLEYLHLWVIVIGFFVVLLVGYATTSVMRLPPRLARRAKAGLIIVVVALSAHSTFELATTAPPRAAESRVLIALMDQIDRNLGEDPGTVVINTAPGNAAFWTFGIANALDHRSVPVQVDVGIAYHFPDRFYPHPHPPATELVVAFDGDVAQFNRTDLRRIARVSLYGLYDPAGISVYRADGPSL